MPASDLDQIARDFARYWWTERPSRPFLHLPDDLARAVNALAPDDQERVFDQAIALGGVLAEMTVETLAQLFDYWRAEFERQGKLHSNLVAYGIDESGRFWAEVEEPGSAVGAKREPAHV